MKINNIKLNNILGFLIFLLLWVVIVNAHLVKPIFLPPLEQVLISLKSLLFSIEGLKNMAYTLTRVAIGFGIAVIFAVPFGIMLGTFKKVYASIEWLVDFFRSVPASALFPLFLIFFGFGDLSKIAMGAWASGFVILTNTIYGVWQTKDNLRIMAQTKHATTFQIISKITLPQTLPFIFAGMRIGISWNLIVVIIAEMFIGTKYGLGHIIYDAGMIFDTPGVIAGIIIIGIFGLILNKVIAITEKKIVHWKGL